MSSSMMYLFAVPKHYKIEEERFKELYENEQISAREPYCNAMFEEVCDIIEEITKETGGYCHCQDYTYWSIWHTIVEMLKKDCTVVFEYENGACGSGGDNFSSLSQDTFKDIICTMADFNEIFNIINTEGWPSLAEGTGLENQRV